MIGCLFKRVGYCNQGGLTERAPRKRHPEWCRVDDRACRRDEAARDHDARVSRLGWRGGSAVLRKQDGVKVVIRAFDAVWSIEDRVQSRSSERQVLSAKP